MVVLQMVHKVGSVAFDLLIAGDSTEDNLRESLRGKSAKANTNKATEYIWVPYDACEQFLCDLQCFNIMLGGTEFF